MMGMLDVVRTAPRDIARTVGDFSSGGPVPVVRQSVRTRDGRTVAYADMGRGRDVMLIHGSLMTLEDMWLGPADTLANDGYRVVAVDRPGHGDSARVRLVDASPWRQAEILHDAMTTLGLRRPTIIGHSAGGAVALAYGMLFPDEVSGVVALAPICFPEPRLEQMLFGLRAAPFTGPAMAAGSRLSVDQILLPTLWRTMFLPQRMPTRFEEGFPFTLAGRPAQMIAEAEDSMALGPGLVRSAFSYLTCRVPVEILGGDADIVVVNAMHGLRAAAMIPGARYRSLPGLGHMLHHFRPEEVLRAVQRIGAAAD